MDKYSLHTHNKRFGTNKQCQDYLVQVLWDGKPKCPRCENSSMNYYLKSRKIYKCSKCYKQFSVIQGTIFERTRIPLRTWFLAIYLFTTKKRGISSVQMSKWLGIKQQSAWFLLHRLREAVKDENDIVLNGIVEADETFVGPDVRRDTRLQKLRSEHYAKQEAIHGMTPTKKYNHNRKHGIKSKTGRPKGATKEFMAQKRKEKGNRIPFERHTVILGMTEKNGRIVMKELGHSRKDINQENVFQHLRGHITSDSILITDESSAYVNSSNFFSKHKTVNHDIAYVIKGIHINNIENAWNHLKKVIDGTYFHLSHRHFSRYLNENTYRWNRRNESEKALFESFISFAADKRITYKKLIGKDVNKVAA
jgi:transposase-like protein